MIPILFIIPKLSLSTLFISIGITALIFLFVFFLYRKKVDSVKKWKNDLIAYFFFIIVLLILLALFGPFPLRTYGVTVALGFLAAILIARRLCEKSDINPDVIFDLAIYVLIGTIIGARLFYVVFYDWSYFISNPLRFFSVWEGGLVFYGGLIGGISAGVYFVRKKSLNVLKMADIVGVTIPLGLFFGRWGCLAYGCCHGHIAPSWFPFKIRFPAIGHKSIGYTPAFEKHLLHGLVDASDKFSQYIYPTQIISSLAGLLLFIILYRLFLKKKFDGQIAGLTLMFYAISRFLIEFLRVEPTLFGLSVSQWIGVFMFVFGLLLFRYAKKIALK